ncbi:S8 family serine peptidase, partial [Rhizobium sp. TRM95111]|uniref:S8 family serine peptidase n=1 Tax=Rhizobium alarense TaxID=2846851 RepID=UPI001F25A2FE
TPCWTYQPWPHNLNQTVSGKPGAVHSAAARTTLEAAGYAFLEDTPVALAGATLSKLQVPQGTSLDAARQQITQLDPAALVDLNHYYRPEKAETSTCSGADCPMRQIVGWPDAGLAGSTCGTPSRIGLVDTAINTDHAVFAGRRIETIRLGGETQPASGRQHGTAVAALLVGAQGGRAPGLLPDADLVAVDAFYDASRAGDRAEAFDLVRALDLLALRRVDVVNMSLAGPDNQLLKRAVTLVSERNIVIVAAAGNAGPKAAPLYPAAYEPVIAVTAVDRAKRPYRRAGQGDHIDIAAPGVNVWTAASISGARQKTGTSFAAPFVTAAVALLKAGDPAMTATQIMDSLVASAEDLGEPGKDPVFGHGLLDARALCRA